MNLQQIISECNSIVFFGGAGVSTESGIPDFRSQDGLYNQQWKYPPETILSRSFFDALPKEFYRFYREKMIAPWAKPNAAHKKLAELEKANKLVAVVTQNIDGLHQVAGSEKVYELHGNVQRNYCMNCGQFYNLQFVIDSGTQEEGIPRCTKCGGIVKPDVVLYEENLKKEDIENALYEIEHADMLIVAGTSLSVYPAAGMIRYFRGKYLVLINKTKTDFDQYADLVIYDSLGNVFKNIGCE